MKTEMYRIVFSNDAKKDLKELSKKAPQAVKKLSKLLEEIQEHPRTGSSHLARYIIRPRITVVMWGLFYSLNTNHLWH